jgi:hypothetical protein
VFAADSDIPWFYEKEILPSYAQELSYFGPEGRVHLQDQTCPQSAIPAARATGGN